MKNLSLSGKIGIGLALLQLVATAVFLFTLFRLGMLPDLYVIGIAAALTVVLIIIALIQIKAKRKAVLSKIFSLLLSVILLTASFYLYKTGSVVASISSTETVKIDKFVVAVREDDPAESIQDTIEYLYGVQYALKEEEIKEAIALIESTLGVTLDKKEYGNMEEQLNALFAGEVQAVVINEAFIEMMDDELGETSSGIKIVHYEEVTKEVEVVPEKQEEEVKVETDAFIVYVSGIDVYGSISRTSRSDVNILAVVNPTTHEILLVTTPRDYYVTFPGVTGGTRDKLTHAGIYGVDVSMAALGQLYDVDPDFYARVNFTSLIKIVNALGGVDVYSEVSFTGYTSNGTFQVNKGMNHFNGEQALSFCRERKSIAGGDYQRGKNQEACLKAIIQKILSPSVITGASDLISSLQGNVDTNMSQKQIQKLIKAQIENPASWSIEMMAATGTGSSNYCYSMPGRKLYVCWPNYDSVNSIKNAIYDVMY